MTPTPTSGKSRTPVFEDALAAHPPSQLPLQPVEVGSVAGGQSPPAQNTLGLESEEPWPIASTNVPGSLADELARSYRPGPTAGSRWPDSRLSSRAFGASTLSIVKMESDEDDLSDPEANEEEASDRELLALKVKQFWDTTDVVSEHRRRRLEERADRLVLRSTGAQSVGEMVVQEYADRYLEALSIVVTEYRKKYPKGTSNSAVSSIAGTPIPKKAPLNKGKGRWDDLFTPQAVASGSNQPLDEAAMAVSALHQARQLGESDDDYCRRAAAAKRERMTREEHLAQPQGSRWAPVSESTLDPPTERKDTNLQLAGTESVPAIQVPPEAKDGRVPLAKEWNNRIAYQRLRNADLSRSKFTNYDDQGVVFEGHMPVDEMARQWASQTQGSDGGLVTGLEAVEKNNSTAIANGRRDMRVRISEPAEYAQPRAQTRGYSMPAPIRRSQSIADGIHAAGEQHKTKMHERLHQLMHERLSVRLSLPDGMKSRRADSKSVGTYSGSAKFGDLEEWLSSLVVMLAVSQFGGEERDQERVLITSEFLDGEARKWYNRHVIHVNREKQFWTFEDVVLGLYDRFVLPSTMQDARNDFNAVTYSASKGIQGLYDDLVDHAMNMAARTDDWTFLEKFLKTLPREMRKALFDDGLSPEINTAQEFLAVGLAHQATQKTADYFERNITAQRNQPSQPRKPDGGRVNTPQNNFNRTRRVFGALNEKPYAKLAYQDQPGRGEQKLHVEKPAMKTGDRPRYDQTKNHDHHNHPPGEVCFNCWKLGHFAKDCKQPKEQRAFLRAARTAAPDAASEADDEDTSPEDPDGRDNGRPETEADNEDEGDEFVDMEVYENEYYARDDETERMFAMTEVIASEERNDKPPSRKVKVRTGRDKIARPVVPIKDKECLVTYINVGGHEAWTLWDSGSTTTGLTPSFAQVADIRVFPLEDPLILQLGTKGSRATVNFGTTVEAVLPGFKGKVYMDLANFDRYDVIIGTPFMRANNVVLDFNRDEVVVNGVATPATKVKMEDTDGRVRRHRSLEKRRE
ncbi:hypothetical protein D9615_008285 [Tricholomella constricta]|uniref:CCHC-type domain-containing protein n=1 Tax=Tricholomella constricta TaxID=117010 RepID=A0A8H5HDE7_9AGAR|nr:hypothetical protein D9615_008285 [Tricholomella constricta]